ncbi:MAG: hypothetical protein JKY46_08120 [Robiginitomaculum sp.]|nr:hypothetical protein [Robiginitomaculum sp.]
MKLSLLFAAATMVFISSCNNPPKIISGIFAPVEANEGPCPQALVLWDVSRKVEISKPENFSNVGFTGEILNVSSFCTYVGDAPIVANLEINFAFGRGPAADGMVEDYPYFIAVTRKDKAVISKETFPLQVKFRNKEEIVYVTEKFKSITIPRKQQNTSGVNFEILVGFELTEDELEFARSGKRFRVPAGSHPE